MAFTLFASSADNPLSLGADALLYVMQHDHTISIPDSALLFAEKVAVLSIATKVTIDAEKVRRAVHPSASTLAAVNRALDLIATSLRQRDRLAAMERDSSTAAVATSDRPPLPGSHLVKTAAPVPQLPSSGTALPLPLPSLPTLPRRSAVADDFPF